MTSFKSLLGFLVTVTWLIPSSIALATNQNSPAGYWKTIDDVTGKTRSIMEIWETPEHTLQGRLAKIFPDPGHNEHELCVACKGANHNKPMLGLMIMWGFKFDGKEKWVDGRILDPRTGHIYHCNLKTMANGNHLLIHGYIGIPLFGRTQTWERAQNA